MLSHHKRQPANHKHKGGQQGKLNFMFMGFNISEHTQNEQTENNRVKNKMMRIIVSGVTFIVLSFHDRKL